MNTTSIIYRNFQNDNDLKAILDVILESAIEDKVDPLSSLEKIPTLENLRIELNSNNRDPLQDILLVEKNQKIIGFCWVCWWVENDGIGLYLHNQFLLPMHRNQGLEITMLEWAEDRINQISKQHQHINYKMYGSNATSDEPEKSRLLEKNNYKIALSPVEMKYHPTKIPAKSNIINPYVIKKITNDEIKQAWDLNNDVYSDRRYISQPTEDDFQKFKDLFKQNIDLCFGIYLENKLIGFIMGSVNQQKAEIVELSILKEHRRRGLASVLLNECITKLKQKGIREMRLHTDASNISGARTLYEKMGFILVKEFVRYRKPIW